MSESRAEVVVLGAGAVGLALAFELAGRGVEVVVLDPSTLPEAASSAALAAGTVGPQASAEVAPEAAADLSLLSRHLYADWVDRIEAESGLACELDARGGLTVALSEAEEVDLDRALDWQRARGLSFEVLGADEARLREPALGPDVVCAFAFPLEVQVAPDRLLRALSVAARAAGARLVTGVPLLAVLEEAGRAAGVATAAGTFRARWVVQAAGERSLSLPGTPPAALVGQVATVVVLDAAEDSDRLSRFVGAASLVVAPRRDGTLVGTGPWRTVGGGGSPEAASVGSLLDRVARLLPAAGGYPVRAVGCSFRWATPDSVPFLGETALPGYLLAAGGDELATAPARAALLADLVTGRTPPLPAGPFSPMRTRS